MITFVDAAPWVTSAGALTQVGIVRRHPVAGFGLGLVYQPIWIAYSFMVHGWGFLLASAGFITVNAFQLHKALQARNAFEQDYTRLARRHPIRWWKAKREVSRAIEKESAELQTSFHNYPTPGPSLEDILDDLRKREAQIGLGFRQVTVEEFENATPEELAKMIVIPNDYIGLDIYGNGPFSEGEEAQ